METKDAIWRRRSIRRYTDEPVSDADLIACLEAALMAPSGINLQPWYFVAVRSDEKLKELYQITGGVFAAFKPVLDKRFERHPEAIDETEEFLHKMGNAKAIILAFMLKPDYEDRTTIIEGISAAMQNILLTACDRGLGSCWLTAAMRVGIGNVLQEHFAPGKGEYLGMITLGHAATAPQMPPRRPGRYEIV